MKDDVFRLRLALIDLELKHEQMKEQDAKRLDPEGERTQLLASVKSDNAEVAAMEQQIKEIMGHTEKLQIELQEIDTVCHQTLQLSRRFCFIQCFLFLESFEESQSERGQKYRDLRKREQVMDEFLSTWEENCLSERNRLKELESLITQTLNKISKQQSLMQLVPR